MIFQQGELGADVSFYQDNDFTERKIDFQKMKDAGAKFVILRGGQNNWIDEDLRDYINAVKPVGLPWASYWFYDSRSSPANQVNLWKIALGADVPKVLCVDLEESYGGAYRGERYWKEFISACKTAFPNSTIMIYTANWWWSSQVVNDPAFFGQYPLWVAQYITRAADVVLPLPWRNKQAHIWQFTNKGDGLKYGVESLSVDLDYWNANFDFNSFWGVSTPPAEEYILLVSRGTTTKFVKEA
jgi:GH25 family lysozyme M1 (1,4-beta-N-acetylmuramidase)